MADAKLSGDVSQYQAAVAQARKKNRRTKQLKAATDLSSTKFDDLKQKDKDELLKVLFLNAGLIAAD